MNKYWYVAAVKPKHEFKVYEKLTASQIETFLPLVERLRTWKDRKKLVSFPLFPNYIFVRLIPGHENFLSVLKVKGVTRFLTKSTGEPEEVPEAQIKTLQILLENKSQIDIYPYLKEGVTVTIKSGSLVGTEGILVKKDNQNHLFIINIDILGQSVCMKINPCDLK